LLTFILIFRFSCIFFCYTRFILYIERLLLSLLFLICCANNIYNTFKEKANVYMDISLKPYSSNKYNKEFIIYIGALLSELINITILVVSIICSAAKILLSAVFSKILSTLYKTLNYLFLQVFFCILIYNLLLLVIK
jgi:hypothetical protein